MEIVKFLLKNGADVNQRSRYGETVLMFAAMRGDLSSVEFFVGRRANVSMKEWIYGRDAMEFARYHKHKETYYYLAEYRGRIRSRD